MFPPKLKSGDEVRILTPARSLALPWITDDIKTRAKKRLEDLGLKVTFGKHVMECNHFNSSSVHSRIEDLHDAYANTDVKMILTVMGGFNSIELLSHIDFTLLCKNPKILCGYSDITALENAIFAKTGIVTYSGPHFFDFGEKKGFEYTLEHFKKCMFSTEPYDVLPAKEWSEDKWGKDQAQRTFHPHEGFVALNKGVCEGEIIGGNLVTFLSLTGTPFMPSLRDKILFLEEDREEHLYSFNRNLVSLTLHPDFSMVKGIVFGRFQSESKISMDDLRQVISNTTALQRMPIIAGVDFGHTTPRLTFPIGGTARLRAEIAGISLVIMTH